MAQGQHRATAPRGYRRWSVLILVVAMVAFGGVAVAQVDPPESDVYTGCLNSGAALSMLRSGRNRRNPAETICRSPGTNRESKVKPGHPDPKDRQGLTAKTVLTGPKGHKVRKGPKGRLVLTEPKGRMELTEPPDRRD